MVGSDRIMLISIEQRINEKFTANAYDLLVARVAKKQAIAKYAEVIKKYKPKKISGGVFVKTSNPCQ